MSSERGGEVDQQVDEHDEAGPSRRPAPILAVAAMLVVVGGTIAALLATRDADRVDTVPADEPTGTPALEALGRTAPATYAATRDWLVVIDGGDMDHLEREPRYDAAPLRGGEKVSIDLPLDGDAFSPAHLVSDDDHAIILGRRCAPPVGEIPTYEERFCSRGEPAAFRVDPNSGDIEEVRVDPEVQALRGMHVQSSQRTQDGWWLFGELQSAGRPIESVLITATPDRLELAGRWTGRGHACVTRNAAYQLVTPETPSLLRIALASGTAEAMELPQLGAFLPRIFVHLVCGPDGPFLTDASGDPSRPGLLLHELHDGAWRERPDLIPDGAELPGDGLSDLGGAVLTWSDEQRSQQLTVIPADGSEPRFVDAGPGDVWHGSSGTRLGFTFDEGDDPGAVEPTLAPSRFPGLGQVPLW